MTKTLGLLVAVGLTGASRAQTSSPNSAQMTAAAAVLNKYQTRAESGDEDAQLLLCMYLGDPQQSVNWCRKRAELGVPEAQHSLGRAYRHGRGVPKDIREAIKWLRLAADAGNLVAQFDLAVIYEVGEGVPQDHAEAVKWWRAVATADWPKIVDGYRQVTAQLPEGAKGFSSIQEMSQYLKNLSVRAYNMLGTAYELGRGVSQDYHEAATWYRLAADQGDSLAQISLGGLYEKGLGVPRDCQRAAKYYEAVAEQQNDAAKFAHFALAGQYFNGTCVPQDFVQAHMWANLAAAAGHPNALELRDVLARLMTPAQLAEAQALARNWTARRSKPEQ